MWFAAMGMIAMVLLAFWPALKNGFIWDDDLLLTDNVLIKLPDGLRYLWFSTAPIDYFPLTYSTFWVEWRLWGMNATGYHLTNILLHAANAVLLWRVLLRLKIPAAWLGAALFAVHPVNVASVSWIAERKNTLALLFFLLSVWWWLKSESESGKPGRAAGDHYALSLAAFVLSLLSKTAGVMLPFILLGLAWWRGGIQRADIRRVIPFFGVAFVMGLITIWFQYHRALEADFQHRSFFARLPLTGYAAWFYLGKAFWPLNLSPVYAGWPVDPHSVIAYLPGVLLVGLLIVLWWYRGTWGRPLFFALGGFLLALFPVLGFLEVNFQQFSWVADHWQYFSLPFVTTLVGAGLYKLSQRKAWALPGRCAMVGIVAACMVLTWQQAKVYNNETIWSDAIKKIRNAGWLITTTDKSWRIAEIWKRRWPIFASPSNIIRACVMPSLDFPPPCCN